MEMGREPGFRRLEFSGERLVDRLETRLREQIIERPALRQWAPDTSIKKAASVFQDIPYFLRKNPHLLKQLKAASEQHLEEITMLIVPGFPLVLAQTSAGTIALAPVLGCTHQALQDLQYDPDSGPYDIFISTRSEDTLASIVWSTAQKDPNVILSYHSSGLSPLDYIALGATGLLSNEVFRMKV